MKEDLLLNFSPKLIHKKYDREKYNESIVIKKL